jgi:hypothetical protein
VTSGGRIGIGCENIGAKTCIEHHSDRFPVQLAQPMLPPIERTGEVSEGTDHPLKVAALAVVGTITVLSLVATQWILPTQTASLNHEITILKERLLKESEEKETLKRLGEKLSQTIEEQKAQNQKRVDSLSAENKGLKDKLFISEKSNAFLIGDAYPIGLDKVKIGDPKSKVAESYRGASIEETGRTIIVKQASEIFMTVRFRHSSNRGTEDKIDNIKFDLGTFERIRNNSLPEVPKNWLQDSLRRVLGEPLLVGEDNKCFLWKTAANEPVYYLLEADSFQISGYVTYPPGCYVSKEQVQKQTRSRQ